MFTSLIGSVVIEGIVGYLAEKSGFTHNGILPSIIICVGGAFIFYFVTIMFGISFLVINTITPFSIRKEIEEDQNTALAILIGSVILGLSMIIAAAIGG